MEERRNAIVELVNAEGSVTLARLREAFPEVSDVTLRSDLAALDGQGRLVRAYGGARSVGFAIGTDGPIGPRRALNVAAKREIARKAAGLVRPSTTIFLDSGSTTTELAAAFPAVDALVFTTSLPCMTELARHELPQVMGLGGRLNRTTMCLSGSTTVAELERLTFDQVFLGASGYDSNTGFTCGSPDDAAIKRALVERAGQVVVLLDASKVGVRGTFSVCGLERVDVLVTDGKPSPELRKQCKAAGVELL